MTTAKLLWELIPIEERKLDLESRNEKPWLSLLQCGRKTTTTTKKTYYLLAPIYTSLKVSH